jgi:hypothetical protein
MSVLSPVFSQGTLQRTNADLAEMIPQGRSVKKLQEIANKNDIVVLGAW